MESTPRPHVDGEADMAEAVHALELTLPLVLRPLARVAYNYWWSWSVEGRELFESLDPALWERTGGNPVRLLYDLSVARSEALAADPAVVARVQALATAFYAAMHAPRVASAEAGRSVAFMCAEFGLDASLPLYAGGLGVLAGDYMKEASDQGRPVIGLGMLYWEGAFHQRLDGQGWQQEYWLELEPERLPAALVTRADGAPLIVHASIRGRRVATRVWRVDVGRVPLFLLDTDLPENTLVDRWITARLYVGDRETRIAQYALLGVSGIRALRAMGITPDVIHLNEGHAAFASLELVHDALEQGLSFDDALAAARERTVFTTHTPVAAGNDTFSETELHDALNGIPEQLGFAWDQFVSLGRVRPEDRSERFGLTPFALRMSRAANGVSRRHGEVSREMWREFWPGRDVADVPIGHITNGVHLPTWMDPHMQRLLDRYLPADWRNRAADPTVWEAVEQIPADELWDARCRMRANLVSFVRDRSVWDRLGRGTSTAYAELAARLWQPGTLTLGFARRIATYKRLYLLAMDQHRSVHLLNGAQPFQVVIAGKAHPQDDEAKRSVQGFFHLNAQEAVGGRAVFLEDYDLDMARRLVAGCDVWVNLPRPPFEASGTSGMKSMLNGGLQLAVPDGWWEEAYDGMNGWVVDGGFSHDPAEQDARDAGALLDLLESQVVPLFYNRDVAGIPHTWVERIKASLRTLGPRFNTARMLSDYAERYNAGVGVLSGPPLA